MIIFAIYILGVCASFPILWWLEKAAAVECGFAPNPLEALFSAAFWPAYWPAYLFAVWQESRRI